MSTSPPFLRERRGGRVSLAVGILAAFGAVMLAASVQGTPTLTPADFLSSTPAPVVLPDEAASPLATPMPLPEPSNDVVGAILGVIFLLLGAAVVALLATLLVRALMRMWRDRPHRRRDTAEVGAETVSTEAPREADAAAPVIRRGIAGALRIIDERADPHDAIIAAWVGLEESAADAGLVRGRSETPAEFTLRIITRREGITDAATSLLRLYEQIRFGGHASGEDDRAAARSALRMIEEGWR
ncbi:hypothetical protein HD600_000043 [Microbacterium ginsengiterrae]|uniref:Protein-glutamine gamma-glutamyltransferase-like C-terminal domain-containing protein n=1 Tax=Microbacterium ginsengiterrae TaxID=546115 RepID=A0A7W9CA13_9MICO|nr:DUF4129 domain-containing protein [Microbacterium ginsengiterrae]MBB5741546.1 hypothetical protein [Microbacterium ginsengiterrae]